MSESILNALIHLFAIVANIREKELSTQEKDIVKEYLEKYLNKDLVEEYLRLFDNYFQFYNRELREESEAPIESYSLISFQITNVCRQIKKGLKQQERIVVFIQLLEFVFTDRTVTDIESKFIRTVAETFNISESEYNNCKALIFEGKPDNIENDKVLVIDNQLREWSDKINWVLHKKTRDIHSIPYKHIYKENLYGNLLFVYLQSVHSFVFRYFGQLNIFIEGQKIIPGHTYFFRSGSIIKGPNISPIYYHDVSSRFIDIDVRHRIVFNSYDVQFKFENSENGIQPINISEESGQLIGIMGGSGVGKSTLLNVLNGKLRVNSGKITINGYSINSDKEELKGLIGYIPQDDLLIEELTVYQNLYYNAKLCFRDFSDEEVRKKVQSTLEDLDLYDIRDLKVGSPLKKFISGGQRKRLNIALELIREPYIMFIDEPTTGLSSMDSEKVMYLLRNLTLKGKLLIVNIHQPSSEIYKLFDKIWILDKGGYPIFQGNPIEAIVYFKTVASQVNAAESECPHCGNVNPEQILKIVEARKIDDHGKEKKERQTPPETWYRRYLNNIESKINRITNEGSLPSVNFKVPGLWKQFRIFSKRNLLSKLSNKQYVILNLFEAPILALILSYFSKFIAQEGYIFAQNKNLPVSLFMGIVVAFFMGLTVSAEEIIKDRRILERESFLNLSRFSYLNSKIIYLFLLSALQTFLYVFISNWVLEIKGMLPAYWLILFTTSCFGNMLGLNISSGLNSVITIYILIPLILVPHLLLSGAMISFDDLHEDITNKKYVPVIGDLMVTRWAYEAIAVKQFKDNKFESYFYEYNKNISEADYKTSFLIPELQGMLKEAQRSMGSDDKSVAEENFRIIKNELTKLEKDADKPPFEYLNSINPQDITPEIIEDLNAYLIYIKLFFVNKGQEASQRKSELYDRLIDEKGRDWVRNLKKDYHNERLADFVKDANEVEKFYRTSDELIQKKDPIYKDPRSPWGRAHFYAPVKIIKGYRIDTFIFNILIIWLAMGVLYYTLVFDVLRKFIHFFDVYIARIYYRS